MDRSPAADYAERVQSIPLFAAALAAIAALSASPAIARGDTVAPPLVLDPSAPSQPLSGHIDAFLDTSLQRDFASIRVDSSCWRHAGDGNYGKPLIAGAVWLRTTLVNDTDKPIARTVALTFSLIDSVTIRVLDGDRVIGVHRAGEDTALADRPIPHIQPRVALVVPAGARRTLILRLADEGAIPAPLVVATADALERKEALRWLEMGLFFGVFLICALFAGLMALRLREPLYVWLTVMLVAICLVVATYVWGGATYLIAAPHRVWWGNRTILWAICVSVGAMLMFADELLQIRHSLPRLSLALRLVAAAMVAMMLHFAFGPFLRGVQVVNILAAVSMLGCLAGATIQAYRGDRVAREFVAGLGALVAGAILMLARTQGWLPLNFFTENTVLFGLTLMLVLMGVAVADRFAAVQRAQREALKAQLEEAQRNAVLSEVFERFVPKQFLVRLGHRDIADISLGDSVQKEMTVLFSDIRGFTTLVESMTPRENFAFVNSFLGHMEPAIHGQRGFIDKYIGDAVMALFDSDTRPDGNYTPEKTGRAGAEHAVRAAVAMHAALRRYNEDRAGRGEPPVRIGVGLHTGELMLGTVGGKDRLNASVIGDAVNLAARVEGLTKRYDCPLLITAATEAALPTARDIHLRPVDRVRVKGKRRQVTLYEVIEANDDATCARRCGLLAQYEIGWQAWDAGDFETARGVFAGILGGCDDRPTALLLERCEAFIADGAPADWDGAATLTEK